MDKDFFYYLIGWSTTVIAIFGAGFATALYVFIRRSGQSLAKVLSYAYLADVFLFLVTAMFGLAGALSAPSLIWMTAYAVRVPLLLFALYTLWKLYIKFRSM